MKFLTYACLIGAATAARLTQTSTVAVSQSLLALKQKQPEEHHEQEHPGAEALNELNEWSQEQLANGGTITKEEAKAKIEELAKDHPDFPPDMWKHMEDMFDLVDANKDGEIDQAEIEAMAKKHENVEWPSQDEVIAWIRGELAKDGDITWGEVEAALQEWAASQNYEIPGPMLDAMKQGFEYLDANGDGAVDEHEIRKAFPDFEGPGEEDEHDEGDAIKAYLDGVIEEKGTIEWKDVKKMVKDFNKPHKVPKKVWKMVRKHFDDADTNGDGHVDSAELDAAFAEDH